MLKNKDVIYILNTLDELFPDASCELVFRNNYELSISVMLSAQTTDKAVNKVTPKLFTRYPNYDSLSKADVNDVIEIIKEIGLAKTKSMNIIKMSKMIMNDYHGELPNTLEELMKLPGVGRKTANVILSEGFGVERLAVDTHVERVSKRLGLVDSNASTLEVEEEIMKKIPNNMWHHTHHLLIHFGRYMCTSRNPQCDKCSFKDICVGKN